MRFGIGATRRRRTKHVTSPWTCAAPHHKCPAVLRKTDHARHTTFSSEKKEGEHRCASPALLQFLELSCKTQPGLECELCSILDSDSFVCVL